jgi:NACalpha-BTF3-like transcription factor
MPQDDKTQLEIALSHLLSFDVEDCHDILEHLLSFESKDDLLEHMISLLGDANTNEIHLFVDNVMFYLNGEPLTLKNSRVDEHIVEDQKMPAQSSQVSDSTQTLEKQRIEKEKKEKQRTLEAERRKQLEEEEAIRLKMSQIRMEQEEALIALKKNADDMNHKNKKENPTETSSNTLDDSQSKKDDVVDPIPKNTKTKKIGNITSKLKHVPEIPLRGKATIVCGCFGTVHKPLTNCLYCGRISCKKEGYGYCPFCSNLIDVPSKNKSLDSATLHKERLLKFDRDAARRTIIYDDQADYYSNSTSTWLSEDEQQFAKVKEDERQKELHCVKKQVMNLQF